MIKVNHQKFIEYDIIYLQKLEKQRIVKQHQRYEYRDLIRQNCELHMNTYNPYIIFELKKLNKDIARIDKCMINLKRKMRKHD